VYIYKFILYFINTSTFHITCTIISKLFCGSRCWLAIMQPWLKRRQWHIEIVSSAMKQTNQTVPTLHAQKMS